MPITTSPLILSLELALLFVGSWLLWKYGLSKSARIQSQDAARDMPTWDLHLTSFLLFFVMIFFGGFLGQALASLFIAGRELGETATLVIAGGAFHGGMLLAVILFKKFFDRLPAKSHHHSTWLTNIMYGVVTVLIVFPSLTVVGLIWQNLLHLIGIAVEEQDLIAIFQGTESKPILTLMILLAVTLAPVTEEMIFRAGIFRYMRTRAPRWAALLVPSLLFGALHLNAASFVPLVALGIILSLAYERTGSITVPIVAHGLFNLNTIVLVLAGV